MVTCDVRTWHGYIAEDETKYFFSSRRRHTRLRRDWSSDVCSSDLTLGEPDSLGVPASFAKHTLTLEYNNAEQILAMFESKGNEIAAVIVEPVAGNMGCVPPVAGFLETIREVCDKFGSLLIFDEVMTGFRVAKGGAQGLYNIKPDITTLGKIIGGGMPVGAFGGRQIGRAHV